jgi:hypothetical protein
MALILDILPWRGMANRIRPYLPEPNFISLHYLYFIGTCLLTSVIFYCTSTPRWSITYTDSLFLVVSAMTEVPYQLPQDVSSVDKYIGRPQYREFEPNEHVSTVATLDAHPRRQCYLCQHIHDPC